MLSSPEPTPAPVTDDEWRIEGNARTLLRAGPGRFTDEQLTEIIEVGPRIGVDAAVIELAREALCEREAVA